MGKDSSRVTHTARVTKALLSFALSLNNKLDRKNLSYSLSVKFYLNSNGNVSGMNNSAFLIYPNFHA